MNTRWIAYVPYASSPVSTPLHRDTNLPYLVRRLGTILLGKEPPSPSMWPRTYSILSPPLLLSQVGQATPSETS